jgi:4-diphosphocytidyl-2-C-methyl-D-erythritol kinase
VAQLRENLASKATLGGMMSGSGPTVYGLTQTHSEATQIAEQIKSELPDSDLEVWVTKFISNGIHLPSSEV